MAEAMTAEVPISLEAVSTSGRFLMDVVDYAKVGRLALIGSAAMVAGWLAQWLLSFSQVDWGRWGAAVTIGVIYAVDICRRVVNTGWPLSEADRQSLQRNALVCLATLLAVYLPQIAGLVNLGMLEPVAAFLLPLAAEFLRRWLADHSAEFLPNEDGSTPTLPNGILPKIFVLCLLLCGAQAAQAAAPKAMIVGPRMAIPGDIVTLDASTSTDATHYSWTSWPRSNSKLVQVYDGGKSCRVASYPGDWIFMLVVSNAEGHDFAFTSLKIDGSPSPGPQPGPQPGPSPGPQPLPDPPYPGPLPTPTPVPTPVPIPPKPLLPDGQFGVSKDVLAWALAVDPNGRAADATRLADKLEGIASEISAGALTSAVAIVTRLRSEITSTLGAKLPAWKTAFGDKLVARITSLYGASKLSEPAHWATLLREIVLGLREAAKN